MDTRFLSDEENTRVHSIMAAHGVSTFSASVKLWGRGKSAQVIGDLDMRELACLLAVLRYLDNQAKQVNAARTSLSDVAPLAYAARVLSDAP